VRTAGPYVAQALRTGEPAVVEHSATAEISRFLDSADARALLAELAPEAAAVLPLHARGRTVGVLSLFTGADRGPIDERDLATAREVADRAGLGLDNALLYRQQQRLAEDLRRSLLTAPPRPDRLQIAVRYVPAAKAAQVGGDWYDAFLQPDGATVLAIGDVVGHDTAAAAAMGQLRGLLRGIAFTTQDSPAGVLTRLDEAMAGLQVATTGDRRGGPDRGGRAGGWQHAAALVQCRPSAPDGPAARRHRGDAHGRAPESPAGHRSPRPRLESEVELERGSTFLLYTDGLIERRGRDLHEGLDLLRDTLAGLAGLPPDDLCDELLARMLPAQPQDDVALVAVRLHS
jgi:hypothetical protein